MAVLSHTCAFFTLVSMNGYMCRHIRKSHSVVPKTELSFQTNPVLNWRRHGWDIDMMVRQTNRQIDRQTDIFIITLSSVPTLSCRCMHTLGTYIATYISLVYLHSLLYLLVLAWLVFFTYLVYLPMAIGTYLVLHTCLYTFKPSLPTYLI